MHRGWTQGIGKFEMSTGLFHAIDCWKMQIKVSCQKRVTVRLKNEKCFSNKKNLIQGKEIT